MDITITMPKFDYTDDELFLIKDNLSKFAMQYNSPEVRKAIEKDIMNTFSDIISNRRDIKINEILNASTTLSK